MSGGLSWAILRIQDVASDLDVILSGADGNRRECLCRGMQEAHAAATAVPVTPHEGWWRVIAVLYASVLLADRSRRSRGCPTLRCSRPEERS